MGVPPSPAIAALKSRAWFFDRPGLPRVTAMLTREDRLLLHHIARHCYTGQGAVIDAGCFIGGSTVALAHGLKGWSEAAGRPAPVVHSYDLFEVGGMTRGARLPAHLKPGDSFRPVFEANIRPYRDRVEIHEGDIRAETWSGGPIEILFIDCAKSPDIGDAIVERFFPHLIPGVSIVVQQDYLYPSWNAWLHIAMEALSPYFEILTDCGIDSVAFRNTAAIPP
ncbi:MAG TPA: hypothetical protein VKS60_05645, partial [Stellaceae bacterium]|nr:hypothetical protein [Stellaceae bacterium]